MTERAPILPSKPQRLQVNIVSRHVAMLDRLAVDMRIRHGIAMSRTGILRAIVEAAEREGWAADLFEVHGTGSMERRRSKMPLVKAKPKRPPRDVITNAHRVFGELIERSEQPPQRGNLKKVAPPPAKKNGATK